MTIFDLLKECKALAKRCEEVLDHSGWSEWEDISSELFDSSDPDQRFLVSMMYSMMDCLDRYCNSVEYLTREEVQEYTLCLDEEGRPVCYLMDYMVEHEYHCGYSIEYLSPNPDYDPAYNDHVDDCPKLWHLSRVEHDGERYYIVGAPELDLEGLRVRVRQRVPF